MEIIKYFIGASLASVWWPFALFCLLMIVIFSATELSEISGEVRFGAKLSHLGRALLITLTGSYFGGLYIDGTGNFPSDNSSIILCFVISALSVILWVSFLEPKSSPTL
jgi:hypothetical protein